ncbi:hypothetical protein GCM10010449_14920 [Streptomyces rectiviolaceus]|uniref:Uncharacterized protein n=1 Tax=Streptomyces rectiviolaceus TaxID=332591 RepID=A0ABP6M9U6_9ACTN
MLLTAKMHKIGTDVDAPAGALVSRTVTSVSVWRADAAVWGGVRRCEVVRRRSVIGMRKAHT